MDRETVSVSRDGQTEGLCLCDVTKGVVSCLAMGSRVISSVLFPVSYTVRVISSRFISSAPEPSLLFPVRCSVSSSNRQSHRSVLADLLHSDALHRSVIGSTDSHLFCSALVCSTIRGAGLDESGGEVP